MKTSGTSKVEELVSPTDSVQSSILLPKFSCKDILYASKNIYGEELGSLQSVHPATMLNLPVSNRLLIKDSGILFGYIFAAYRQILGVMFMIYEWYLKALRVWSNSVGLFGSFFWFVVTFMPVISENVSLVETKTETDSTYTKSSTAQMIKNLPTNLKNIHILIGNYALTQSLSRITHPKSRMIIRKSLGNFIAPHHCAFILEMNVLAIKQPPEIPTPYLDAEKKLIVPEKQEIAKTMTLRAEWATAHRTHKAAETVRIIYESAKVIAWSACSNIRMVTLYERTGYGWKGIHQLANLVQEEMRNLTKTKYNTNDYIKIVDLDSGKSIVVLDHNTTTYFDEELIKPVSPSPQTAISSFDGETVPHQQNTSLFSTYLTVFLLSGRHVTEKSGIKDYIGYNLSAKFNVSIESDFLNSPRNYVSEYKDPQLVIKYAGKRQQLESLDGFPLAGNKPICIKYYLQPVSFAALWEGCRSFSKQLYNTKS